MRAAINLGYLTPRARRAVASLLDRGCRVVFMDCALAELTQETDSVIVNDQEAAKKATEYLLTNAKLDERLSLTLARGSVYIRSKVGLLYGMVRTR